MNQNVCTTLCTVLLWLTFCLTSCVERTGYYTDAEENVISLICDIDWMSKVYRWDNGHTVQNVWNFERNGTYTRTSIETDADGTTHRSELRGQWAFAHPSSNTLIIGHQHYWDIEKLTRQEFAFYDRRGELGDLSMTRTYEKLTPVQKKDNSLLRGPSS